MKLATFKRDGSSAEEVGILLEGKIFALPEFKDMLSLIEASTPETLRGLERRAKSAKPSDLLENFTLLAPIPRPRADIICLGLNYRDHIEEAARFNSKKFGIDMPKTVYFSKRAGEALPPFGKIPPHEDMCDSLDYEAELAVIISKNCRGVKAENAAECVFGYTIINDVSARNVQTSRKQWFFGKSLDGFCPMGPVIAAAGDFPFPPSLSVRSSVNKEPRQNSNTKFMIRQIGEIIEELSSGFELRAGDIIATGTPSGVGLGFSPPKFLRRGDEIACEIEGIGSLVNFVG